MQESVSEGFNVLPIVMPLFGVLIGGGITFGYQSYFRSKDRERTRLERVNRFHRFTMDYVTDILVTNRDFLYGTDPTPPLWKTHIPVLGFDTRPLSYNLDDLSVAVDAKYGALTNELIMLLKERNACFATAHMYIDRRDKLFDALKSYTKIKDGKTSFDPAYKTDPTAARYEVEAEALARSVRDSLIDMAKRIIAMAKPYNAMIAGLRNTDSITDGITPLER